MKTRSNYKQQVIPDTGENGERFKAGPRSGRFWKEKDMK